MMLVMKDAQACEHRALMEAAGARHTALKRSRLAPGMKGAPLSSAASRPAAPPPSECPARRPGVGRQGWAHTHR